LARDPATGRRRGRLVRAVNDLTELLDATGQIAAQTGQRLAGLIPDGATRRVSLHDGDARPIAKDRLGKPVEFGYEAQLVDNDDGIVVDHTVNHPADAPRLAPAVERVIKRTGRATDGHRRPGLRRKSVEGSLHEMGVRTVVIPRKGRPSNSRQAEERRRAFGRTVKWRTGSEGRISTPQTRTRLEPHTHR
jgi:IS5 family transposase